MNLIEQYGLCCLIIVRLIMFLACVPSSMYICYSPILVYVGCYVDCYKPFIWCISSTCVLSHHTHVVNTVLPFMCVKL